LKEVRKQNRSIRNSLSEDPQSDINSTFHNQSILKLGSATEMQQDIYDFGLTLFNAFLGGFDLVKLNF